jgi:DNA-binding XRE family transcriptional regulator
MGWYSPEYQESTSTEVVFPDFSGFSGGDDVAEKDPKLVELGNRIRELREAAGMTRVQLAEAAGVSWRAVTQWELAEREPGWFNVLALAEALAVDVGAFAPAKGKGKGKGKGKATK